MKYETPILETDRLILKKGTLDDLKKVYEYNFSKLRNIAGEFKFEKFDPKRLEDWNLDEPETFDWIMYLKENMRPIGNIVADRENKDIHAIELAFNTHPNYWRFGYTTEAIIEIMRFLFNNGYENILCGYDEGNFKSKALNEKLGFEPYEVHENAYVKNGIPITTYTSILSKDKFNELYKMKKTQI